MGVNVTERATHERQWQRYEYRHGRKMNPRKVTLPSISFIVARSYPDHVIGCENELPWHLGTDLKHFKNVTKGHPVIMGRKTFQSIGRPLPGRLNVVLSKKNFDAPPSVEVVSTHEDALFAADYHAIRHSINEVFVIGGDQIYKIFEDRFNKVYLTEVFTGPIRGDAHFDYYFDLRQWKSVAEEDFPKTDSDDFPFRITTFQRRMKYVRILDMSDLHTERGEKIGFLEELHKKTSKEEFKRIWESPRQKDFFEGE